MLSFKFTAKKVWREIDRSSKILLHIHPGPDADSVGSALAMYHVLKSLNKDVTLIQGDNDLPKNLITLPGADKIIPKNIFQIDLNQYDLFLILDSSSPKQISRLGTLKFPKKLKTVCIDHHISSEKFAQINLICPTSPATCQVLFDLFQLRKIKLNNKIAACLFAGIYTDTGGFKYLNTTYKTLNIVSQLTKIYPQFTKLIFDIENTDQPDRLKLVSILLGSIETYFSNHVAIASISFDEIEKNKLSSNSLNGNSEVSNMIKSVVGWDIA
ncbi:MAG: DHH family phosphoesterase, partial [Candidatus Shapirobacteria bacterium]|nr:DHH family phosphoesterase [Candidatus Shapirobacteria bacterium]